MPRELKPVSFNPNTKSDIEILNYIDELGVSFGSYVKYLIRKDMRADTAHISTNETTNETGEIVNQLRELVNVLKSSNISIGGSEIETDNETALDNVKIDTDIETEEERKARLIKEKKDSTISNILNMGG